MALTPSKDYKRQEREQKKRDKRIEREAAKAEKKAAGKKLPPSTLNSNAAPS